MRDLNVMVHGQEETLKEVEAHSTIAARAAEIGVRDLEKARDYLTSCRCKACFALLLVTTLITVLLVLHFAITPPLV